MSCAVCLQDIKSLFLDNQQPVLEPGKSNRTCSCGSEHYRQLQKELDDLRLKYQQQQVSFRQEGFPVSPFQCDICKDCMLVFLVNLCFYQSFHSETPKQCPPNMYCCFKPGKTHILQCHVAAVSIAPVRSLRR